MAKYKVILAKRVDTTMLRHTQFLAQVSVPAAKQFYKEFKEVLDALKRNPFQFPVEEDQNLPKGQYRKALFAKRYHAIFMVEGETVYLDAVVDCRMEGRGAPIQS